MAQHEVHCVQGEQGGAPLLLLLPKAPETQVKVLLCVTMETVGEDGHVTLVAPVPSAEKEKHSHQQHHQVLRERSYTPNTLEHVLFRVGIRPPSSSS